MAFVLTGCLCEVGQRIGQLKEEVKGTLCPKLHYPKFASSTFTMLRTWGHRQPSKGSEEEGK